MNELINDLVLTTWYNLSTNLVTGDINLLTGILGLILAVLLSVLGGAIGGMILAGRDISYSLAARIGGLFGPTGVFPAILLGLVILSLLK
ncbi:MAG: hypothetical protein QNJ54_31560 [Prochloraceae cyanobacterium]|nr:hypothetical protein [Prochloraceae cyanobacterium]